MDITYQKREKLVEKSIPILYPAALGVHESQHLAQSTRERVQRNPVFTKVQIP
jgi:hypothetical protein